MSSETKERRKKWIMIHFVACQTLPDFDLVKREFE